jgi:hypothetical protein
LGPCGSCSGCVRLLGRWREILQIFWTLLLMLSKLQSFYYYFWCFVSVGNTTLNISSLMLAVTSSFMIPEGLKQDQKVNWR